MSETRRTEPKTDLEVRLNSTSQPSLVASGVLVQLAKHIAEVSVSSESEDQSDTPKPTDFRIAQIMFHAARFTDFSCEAIPGNNTIHLPAMDLKELICVASVSRFGFVKQSKALLPCLSRGLTTFGESPRLSVVDMGFLYPGFLMLTKAENPQLHGRFVKTVTHMVTPPSSDMMGAEETRLAGALALNASFAYWREWLTTKHGITFVNFQVLPQQD